MLGPVQSLVHLILLISGPSAAAVPQPSIMMWPTDEAETEHPKKDGTVHVALAFEVQLACAFACRNFRVSASYTMFSFVA